MSTDLLDDPELTSEDATPEVKKPKFGLGNKKIKILLLLVLVMGVEAAGLYFFLPHAGSSTSSNNNDDDVGDTIFVDTVEVEIAAFMTTNNKEPTANIHISFKVTAVVAKSQSEAFREHVNITHPALIREAIESVWRDAHLKDLDAPDLSVIKSKIKDNINKSLKRDYVKQIIIINYQKNQQ